MSRRAPALAPYRCQRCGTADGPCRPGQGTPVRRPLSGLVPGCRLIVCLTCYYCIHKRVRLGLPPAPEEFRLPRRPAPKPSGLPPGVYARPGHTRGKPYYARARVPGRARPVYVGSFATPAAAAAALHAYTSGRA